MGTRHDRFAEAEAVALPASAALDVEPRMNLATGEDPRGLGPREGDDPLGDDPLGGLLPLGRMLAVGRVLVTVASSAEGSGTAPRTRWVGRSYLKDGVSAVCLATTPGGGREDA